MTHRPLQTPVCLALLLAVSACGGGEVDSAAAADNFDAPSNRGQAYVTDDRSDPNILDFLTCKILT